MLIDGIKIVKQKRNNTCGYVTAVMILNYFQESNIDEDYLLENEPFDEKGIFTLADTYGFNKTIDKDDFFTTISFRNDCLPEFIKKVMPSNAMIKFSKRI